MTTDDRPTCPVTGCHRRRKRTLCNLHMRRVGRPILALYFEAMAQPIAVRLDNPRYRGLRARMITNAEAYDRVRADGFHPVYADNQWHHPRERAHAILAPYANQVNDIGAVVDRLYPRETPANAR